jgi:hypothetical protein
MCVFLIFFTFILEIFLKSGFPSDFFTSIFGNFLKHRNIIDVFSKKQNCPVTRGWNSFNPRWFKTYKKHQNFVFLIMKNIYKKQSKKYTNRKHLK